MANNLELQAELNELLEKGDKLLSKNTKHYQDQASIMANLIRAHQMLNNSLDPEKVESLAQSLEHVTEQAEKQGESIKHIRKFGDALDEASRKGSLYEQGMIKAFKASSAALKELELPFKKLDTALSGLKDGLSFVVGSAKLFASGITSIGKVLGHLALSVIAFPFKVLSNLINASGSGGDSGFRQQLEEVRKEFGYLNKTAGGETINMFKEMRGEIKDTGLSVYRVFGNMTERLKYVFDYLKGLGPLIDNFNFRIGDGGAKALGAFNKGLGLTTEGQKAIATRSTATGKTVNDVNREIANYSIQLSNQFGLTMKEVSRSVGEMMTDFEHFGHLGAKELTQVAVYARKLGIEVKAMSGVFEKSFNLEDAATQAAQLSQAFGLNIDAMEQMKEQDPAKKLDNLRKAFFNAGRSVENMTAQERRLLAQQTGLDAGALDLAFSLKNQSLSYDQIQKKGDQAKKAQLSQTEVMQKLAGAIERLVKSGGGMSGGFLDRFFAGFNVGIRRTKEFRTLMRDLRRDLYSTFRTGIQVGREFVHVFPGIEEVLTGIDQFFKPQKFRAMLGKIREAFSEFFHGLTSDPKQALPLLFERLKKGFFDYFQSNSEGGKRLLDGTQKFFMAFATIVNGMLKIALANITVGLRYITDIISGTKKLPSINGGASGAAGFVGELIGNLIDGLGPVLTNFWQTFSGLMVLIWETKAKPFLARNLETGIKSLLGVGLVPIAFAASKLIGLAIAKGVLKTVSENLGEHLGNVLSKGLNRAAQSSKGTNGDISGGIQEATRNAQATQNASKIDWKKADVTLLAIAAFIIIGMVAFYVAVQKFKNERIEDIIKAAVVMGAVSLAVLAAAGVAKVASGIENVNPEAILAIGIVFAAMTVGALAIGSLVIAIQSMDLTKEGIIKTAAILAAMIPLFYAASGIAFIASKIPAPDQKLAAGIGAILIVVLAMGLAAEGMLLAFGDIASSQIDSTVKIMESVSKLFIAATIVTGVAALIGDALAATGGLGIGTLLVGIASIGMVVYGMAEESKKIIESLNSLPNTSGLQAKVKMFVEIVEAMVKVAESFGSIISAGSVGIFSSISGLLRGANPAVEAMDSINTIIRVLGDKIMEITRTVTSQIATLPAGDETIRKGELIASIIRSVAELAKALAPPTAILEESWVPGTDTVSEKLDGLRTYVGFIVPQVSGLFTLINNQLKTIGNPSEAAIKGAGAISSILGGLGQFITAIGQTTTKVADNNFFNTIDDLRPYMTKVIESVQNLLKPVNGVGIFSSINDIITNIVASTQGIDATRLKAVETLVPVIGPLFNSINSVMTLLTSINPVAQGGSTRGQNAGAISERVRLANAQIVSISAMKSLVVSLFDKIKEVIPSIISSLSGFGNMRIGQINNIKTATDSISKIFEVIPNLLRVVSELGTQGEGNAKAFSRTAVADKMLSLNLIMDILRGQMSTTLTSLGTLNLPKGIAAKATTLKTTFEGIAAIGQAIKTISELNFGDSGKQKATIGKLLTTIGTVLTGLTSNSLFATFDSMTSQLNLSKAGTSTVERFAQRLDTVTTSFHSIGEMAPRITGTTATAVRDMVAELNNISRELTTLTPINIVANLERTAHNLGLGYAREFTINTPKVNLTVNATITVDAQELETVLIARPTTRIAHR